MTGTPLLGSNFSSSDERVRIKCFLGDDIRVFHVSRRVTFDQLLELLETAYLKPIQVWQYEDNEEDRVTVKSSFDLEEAFAVYDHMKTHSQSMPTLKLYLKVVHSNEVSNPKLSQSTPEIRTSNEDDLFDNGFNDSTHPPITKRPLNINSRKIASSTPPLRTPPPSPPSTEPQMLNSVSLETPPLRTPPPSPPTPRKQSLDHGELSLDTPLGMESRIESPFSSNETEVEEQKPMFDTPPLRTPPPSPPRSLHSSNSSIEVESDNEIAEKNNIRKSFNEKLEGKEKKKTLVDERTNVDANSIIINWKKGQKIGTGGFGDVYLGLNNDTGELFAVKQLEIDMSTDDKTKRSMLSYQQEIEVMRKLNHPNIVRYLGTQLIENFMFIFLEFVPGGSIRSILTKFGPLSENNIRIYTKQILHGLQYLHENSVIHRDIKGANILVGTNGTIKLADFGCAKILAGLQSLKSVLGSPYWMAPEVIRAEGYGRSADIWSLGCTIIEMASLRPPWAQEFPEPAAAMFHIASIQEIPQIPDLSPEAHDFLIRCFKRDPKERPDSFNLLNHAFIRHGSNENTNSPSTVQLNSKETESSLIVNNTSTFPHFHLI